MDAPTYILEQGLSARGHLRIVGIDEVGRGPLAGPVTAAAVVLDPGRIPEGLNDSKKLSAKTRRRLADVLHAHHEVSIGEASVEEIDRLNILRASHLAMQRAVAGLSAPPDFALVDGHLLPVLSCGAQPVVKGDTLCLSIAAASIVAKTWRDQGMVTLAQQHAGYGWETNVGYGTAAHLAALKSLGVTPHHRRSFKPVHNILYQTIYPSA
ncbi:ribonuclease HII [Oceaniglobus roseus]|uniref:ribonuclease HII n=1 Tax=Oceaniglobus roseus TaxID=1737570 RepID=UPI000C7F4EE7|nr:ribonuclease HII [Kandeliimicrobium roseum]